MRNSRRHLDPNPILAGVAGYLGGSATQQRCGPEARFFADAAQWITRYIRHMAGSNARLDYAVIMDFHPEQTRIITGTEPFSIHGDYRLQGITADSEMRFARDHCPRWPPRAR